MRFPLLLLIFAFLLWGCRVYREFSLPEHVVDWKVKELPATAQDFSGDPDSGFHYLAYGDYLESGVPLEIMERPFRHYQDTLLKREGINGGIPPVFNAFRSGEGVLVLSGNCFTCHAGMLRGEYIPGFGNRDTRFREKVGPRAWALQKVVQTRYKKGSAERHAFQPFGKLYREIAPYVRTRNPGINPAFRLEEACARWRDPVNLQVLDTPQFEMIPYTLASDVPPLWNLDKKKTLYYNGMGRGDFSKLLMQAVVLGIRDSTHARETLAHFRDVLAWAAQLQPPPFPGKVDPDLVQKGMAVFGEHCSGCHGTYGEGESYPNKLISLELVGTDPLYAQYFMGASHLPEWYNQSWFAQSQPASFLLPEAGYVAPPLDGIWATAPYLHNGSVPTLAALLDSSLRPDHWEIPEDSQAYDLEKVGLEFREKRNGKGKDVYDTTLPGCSNKGHHFGDDLSKEERWAVIEFLKTL